MVKQKANEGSGASVAPTQSDAVTRERGSYILEKIEQQSRAKVAIANRVAEKYVANFDSVLLDAGSTAEAIAAALFRERKWLSVMTINMGAYAAYTAAIAVTPGERAATGGPGYGLLNENELLLPGGRYVPTYEALLGDGTLEALGTFTPRVTIIGVSGLRSEDGVFCHGAEELQVKHLLWTMPADTRLIAADWSKIGKRDAHAFGKKVSELSVAARRAVIVTNAPPEGTPSDMRQQFDEQIRLIKDLKIEVELVKG